jgi:serine/threonine-protein kinase
MTTPSHLVSAIKGLAAGRPVDWSTLEGAPADESVAAVLNELRVIAQIARVHGTATSGAPTDRDVDDSLDSWGPLTVLERIGEGSYGIVYRAWDSRLDREVALKLLRPGRTLPNAESPAIEEGRLLARVRHPNVVSVYGADCIGGRIGIWMEFINGRTLEEIVQSEGPLPAGEATRVGLEIARGLAAVHRAGIVHRDVKAQNVMVQDDGRVVLMDLGSGHPFDDTRVSAAGTPLYVAPEVLAGGPATAHSDVYSFGVLLYHLVTGSYPRRAATIAELKQHAAFGLPPVQRSYPYLPHALARAIDGALAPHRSRSGSVEEVERALRGRHRPWRGAGAAAVGLSAAVVAGALMTRATPAVLQQPVPRPVLVSQFENNTNNPSVGAAVESAFERELAGFQVAVPATQRRAAEVLALMLQPAHARLDIGLAREVAVRDGEIRAVITGRIEQIGRNIVVSAEALNPSDGAVMASVSESAVPPDRLIGVVRREAGRLGGTLAGTDNWRREPDQHLQKVTTRSLRALQLYSQAADVMGATLPQRWDNAAGERYLEDALREDQDFPSAHILLAWAILNQHSPCHRCDEGRIALAHAERAMSLAGSVSSVERHFIAGSVHRFRAALARTLEDERAEQRQAVAEWEQVVEEQPDHPWALNNIQSSYQQGERISEMARWLGRLSDRAPRSFAAAVDAVFASRDAGDASALKRFRDRALALMTPDAEKGAPQLAARLRFLDVEDAWLRDDPQGVIDALASLESDTQRLRPAEMPTVTLYGFYAALGIGRLHEAEARVARLALSAHDVALIRLLKERRDLPAVRMFVRSRLGNPRASNLAVSIAEAGFVNEAREIVQKHAMTLASLYIAQVEATIAAAEHRLDDVIGLTQRLLPALPFGDRHVQVSMMAADALVQRGKISEAIAVLEESTAHRAESSEAGPQRWMNARAELAALYRRVGREQEARAIEDHLLALLAVADPDHPLLLELHERASRRGPNKLRP